MSPTALLAAHAIRLRDDEALVFWGKAAGATEEAVNRLFPRHRGLRFRVRGEHPLPGPASFRSGGELLEFLAALDRFEVSRLTVFLSGGASSQAWVPPADLPPEELLRRLRALYRAPLDIAELNRRRSRLCALKGGGAARWLHRLAPRVRARVVLISDVAPFGPEVVGSGPFWDSRVPHLVLADNAALLDAAARLGRSHGLPLLAARSGCVDSLRDWASELSEQARRALARGQKGLILRGGEPRIALPSRGGAGRGGRQTQLAAALALELWRELLDGAVEIACLASDGVDGRSRASGALLDARAARALQLERSAGRASLDRALARFDAATPLGRARALIPERASGTNVQDFAVLRI